MLSDSPWLCAARDQRGPADGARLDNFLREAGFEILGGTVLFRLVRHAAPPAFVQTAQPGKASMRRAFAYAPDRIRFGLPADDEAFRRLAKALGL